MQQFETGEEPDFRVFLRTRQPTRSSVFGAAVFATRYPAMSCDETQVLNIANGESRTLALS